MTQIAGAARGKHFDATGSGGGDLTTLLSDAFRNVANEISRTTIVK